VIPSLSFSFTTVNSEGGTLSHFYHPPIPHAAEQNNRSNHCQQANHYGKDEDQTHKDFNLI